MAYTQPNGEQRAYDALRAQHASIYFPRIKVRRSHAHKLDWAYRPFLARYLFVEDDGRGVSYIKRSSGVSDVVRSGLEPIRVPQSVIDAIREREDEHGFVLLDEQQGFESGEMLRVTYGPLAEQNVIFKKMSGEARAAVFIHSVMSGTLETEVPRSSLRRLSVV